MTIILLIPIFLTLAIYLFMQTDVFGKKPKAERLEKIKLSENYRNGSFQNLSKTEVMLPESSAFKVLREYYTKPKDTKPFNDLPFVKTDLYNLTNKKPVIVWFGHSSYFIQINGFKILVDPVFSGNASPLSFFGKSFKGSNEYKVEDFPEIDLLIITHDHYDHLDYKTVKKLESRVNKVITSLGVGESLESWGFKKEKITELDWWKTEKINNNLTITAAPARHFSGRGFKRGLTLWSSFILEFNDHKIYVGGDSGYDSHFKTIGDQYGPFDIAILEVGQYGKNWPYIHMMPEETVAAAKDLKAKVLLPVHWGKFVLSTHSWYEPIKRVTAEADKQKQKIVTPMIGEPLYFLDDVEFDKWWELHS